MPKSRDDSGELVITSESIIFVFKSIGKVCVIGRLVMYQLALHIYYKNFQKVIAGIFLEGDKVELRSGLCIMSALLPF